MTRMPATQRRALLLQAAWRVVVADGVAGATTRAICGEAGMPQSAFHYCFASRDALFRELAGGLLPGEVDAAVAAVDRRGSFTGAVYRALLAYWRLVEADPAAHQVLYEITTTALRDPTMQELAREQYRRYLGGAAAAIRAIAEVREISWDIPEPVLARQVVTILDGLTLHYIVDRDARAARAALQAFADDLARHGRPAPKTVRSGVPVGTGAVC